MCKIISSFADLWKYWESIRGGGIYIYIYIYIYILKGTTNQWKALGTRGVLY